VSKNHRTVAAKVTAELSIHLEDPISTQKVAFPGLFQHTGLCGPIVFLPQQVPAFITRGATHMDARDLYQRRRPVPEKAGTTPKFCQRVLILKISAGIFNMPQSWDMGHIILLHLRRKAY
jgi:hypothetical protein